MPVVLPSNLDLAAIWAKVVSEFSVVWGEIDTKLFMYEKLAKATHKRLYIENPRHKTNHNTSRPSA